MEGPALSPKLAYKFLRTGGVGPFSGFAWPLPAGAGPGEWVEAATRGGPCRDGVHACERADLPRWIWEELWEVELDGPVERGRHKLRASRGRLLRRVDTWTPAAAAGFAEACTTSAAEHAVAAGHDDAALAAAMAADCGTAAVGAASDHPYPSARGAAVCAYIAAMTAHRAGGVALHEAERQRQADWLARELGLSA